MSTLISMIVPVYKVAAFLPRCIESLMAQTYQNIEIILIDDGSPDECPQICDRYEKQDSRIKVVHKKNGGVSSARNAGLDMCSGEYVGFIDGDDWIAPNFVETMFSIMVISGADLVQCNWVFVDEKNNIESVAAKSDQQIVGTNAALISCFQRKISHSVCDKLLKKELISSIRFNETLAIGEDIKFVFDYCMNCQKAQIISEELYFYFQRSNSVMHEEFNEKYFQVIDRIDMYYQMLRENSEVYPYCIQKDIFACFNLLKLIGKEKKYKLKRKELRRRILRNGRIIFFSRTPIRYSIRVKGMFLLLKFFPYLGYYLLQVI